MLRWLAALVLVAGAIATAVPLGLAQEDDPDPKSQSELRAAIGEAAAEETVAALELQETQARRAELEAVADALEAEVAAANERMLAAQAVVDRIVAEQDALEREIIRIQAEIDVAEAEFGESAAGLYRNAGSGGVLSVIEYSDDPRSAVAADRYLEQISDDAQAEADRAGVLKDDLDATHEMLEAQRREADTARAAAQAERDKVAEARAAHEPARAAAEAEEASEQDQLDSISSQRDEWEAQLAALQAEQAALAQGVSRGSGNGVLGWPCDGNVASGFGYRTHPILGYSRLHTGVDIGCANTAPISAAGDGVVLEAGPRGGYGNAVLIDHGDGLATLYAHQSQIAASPGQTVSRGEVIGYVGSTGLSTGPHLHWEVWVNGTPVDPMGYA